MKTNPSHSINKTFSEDHTVESIGLTKREYFAGLAMQGMLASCKGYDGNTNSTDNLAECAVKQADALIEQLQRI